MDRRANEDRTLWDGISLDVVTLDQKVNKCSTTCHQERSGEVDFPSRDKVRLVAPSAN